jgi:hypothetical protein
MYYGSLGLLFGAIAFYFGPNMIMFGKLTWITPTDFVGSVDEDLIDVVRAVKRYERDHGSLPERVEDCVPKYLPRRDAYPTIWKRELLEYTKLGHTICYGFAAYDEGWWVRGPFVVGRIPLPPVSIPPLAQPTSQPD